MMFDKKTKLFIILSGFFIANALIAEMIGGKIFSLEETFGVMKCSFSLLGETDLSFDLTAGVLLWPIVFVMTDIINEYYGPRGVRLLSYLAAGLILFAFGMIFFAIYLTPATWWMNVYADKGVPDAQAAFKVIFGQGLWIIAGSLLAFLIGQVLDVFIFHKIKRVTGDKGLWLRATGSTLVSQLIDSFVVLFIAFKLGQGWPLAKVLAIALVGYLYKFIVAVFMTPVIYAMHKMIDKYLGKELSEKMQHQAMQNE